MRRPTAPFFSALALFVSACASGPAVVHVHSTRPAPVADPAPVPPPAPAYLEPLEVTLGRPVRGNLVVQTNRPAYVAIFEIVPEQGVTLVRPVSAPQRRFVVSGVSGVPVWWATQGRTPANARPLTRYIYAVASDEPLRLPDEAFRPGYLQRTLGLKAYRASAPYVTMRAISRQFVAVGADEYWAEDAYAVAPAHTPQPEPVARVHCPGGVVHEVPVELADRTLCPPSRIAMNDGRGRPTRPDSAVDNNGRRVRGRGTPNGRGPIDRVTEGLGAGNNGRGPQATGNNGRGPHGGAAHAPAGHADNGGGSWQSKDTTRASGPVRAVTAARPLPRAAGRPMLQPEPRVKPAPQPNGEPARMQPAGPRDEPRAHPGEETKVDHRPQPRAEPAPESKDREAREREAKEKEAKDKEAKDNEARQKQVREQEEKERKARVEQERREQQEMKAREEADRKAKEEQDRKDERDRKEKEERDRKAAEEKAQEEAKANEKREQQSGEKGNGRGRPGASS